MPAVALQSTVDAAPLAPGRPARPGPAVPWHCQGAAQRLIDRIGSNDRAATEVIKGLIEPVAARLQRSGGHSPARKSSLIDIERDWRIKLDTKSRLSYTADFSCKGKALHLFDARITGVEFTLADWPAYEPGLALIVVKLRLAPDGVALDTEKLAFISRHAIGRRFERGYGDDDAVLADFQRLAHALTITEGARQCVCPSGGWVGDLMRERGQPLLAVRTFLPASDYTAAWLT